MGKKYGSLLQLSSYRCWRKFSVSIRNKPANRDLMEKIALSPKTFLVTLLGPVAVFPNRVRGPTNAGRTLGELQALQFFCLLVCLF